MTKNQLLRHNWKTISKYLRHHTSCQEGEDLKSAKDVFFGKAPPESLTPSLPALVVAPHYSEGFFEVFESRFRSLDDKRLLRQDLEKVQTDIFFYFGENSIFGKKEKQIYDHFMFEESEEFFQHLQVQIKELKFPHIRDYFGIGNMHAYLKRVNICDHNQLWRHFFAWDAKIRMAPAKAPDGELGEGSFSLLSVNTVCSNEERFSPNVVRLCKLINSTLCDSQTVSWIRNEYERLIETNQRSYAQKSCVGAKVTMCIHYSSEDQLNACIDLLDPKTRYPYHNSNEEEIYSLNHYDGEIRVSVGVVQRLWQSGLEITEYRIGDDNKLFINCFVGFHRYSTLVGLSALIFNCVGLEERYLSKKPMYGDRCISNARDFNSVIIFETIDGDLALTCREGKDPIMVKDYPWIEKIFEKSESLDNFASELIQKSNFKKLQRNLVEAKKYKTNKIHY